MTACLRSFRTQLPSIGIDQEDAARLASSLEISLRWNHAIPALYRKSGVGHRYSVLLHDQAESDSVPQDFYLPRAESTNGPSTSQRMAAYEQFAPPLLEAACRNAMEDAGIHPTEIHNLITVSCTGFCAPGIDHRLMGAIGMSPHIHRTHVGFMGCHGMINGMRTADAIVRADPNAIALVGAVELCSLHQQYTDDPQQLVANALFADGAAGVMVVHRNHAVTAADKGWEILSTHSIWIPDTDRAMSWKISDHGFVMQLSPEVPSVLRNSLHEPVSHWLSSHGLSIEQIDHWAIHPGGPRILDACEAAFRLPASKVEDSRAVLRECGNMSSPTVIFILERITAGLDPASTSPVYCLMIAFGPGLHAELMLLRKVPG
ncbi:Alpha-pyrone synthesis polyketide synthase-like Pks18 [Pirellula sp. SH-Sr6A]|uniref:type III polyketide synthase n=1 Tax=Pirellula sp. SH-Sr6A TaxID=1632865 RepID=UPI00078EF4D2|nr:type III polyketide synthase [Pirellula sp. SH-Sr6A]AMV33809.1 Alpha-pyrone synthesis polyketide synthase-like Pks18 [Pirellula sp. SH-Sr6A]